MATFDAEPELDQNQITKWLHQVAEGDTSEEARLLEAIMSALRSTARGLMQSERDDHVLQPTALVNEVWLRLFRGASLAADQIKNRGHFLAIAARAMGQILVDYGRRESAQKRNPEHGKKIQGDQLDLALEMLVEDIRTRSHADNWNMMPWELNELLDSLEQQGKITPRQRKLIDLRFFCGLSVQEAASALAISLSTAEADWRYARAVLRNSLDA